MIYQYVVSSHPNNWAGGHTFTTIKAAREFLVNYGEEGACITEVKYEFSDSELVEDTRDELTKLLGETTGGVI